MKILGVDTALGACSVAAVAGNEVVAHRWVAMPKGHAETLAPMVDVVMGEAGWRFAEIERLAVTSGPGTFTGQRVGLAFMRGLRLALGIPLVGLTTLEAMAAAAAAESGVELAAVLHEAKRGEAYGAVVRGGELILPPQLAGFETMLNRARDAVAKRPGAPIALAGTAAEPAAAWFAEQGLNAVLTSVRQPDARWVARLAATIPEAGGAARALYLRAPDAKLAKASLRVRRAEPGEGRLLASLNALCLPQSWEAGFFDQVIGEYGGFSFIGEANGVPLGFVLGRAVAEDAEILALGVLAAHRRNGLGRLLLQAAAECAGALGARALVLEVARNNVAAMALYTQSGLREAGFRKNYYGATGGGDAVLLRGDIPDILAVGIDGEVA